MDRRKFIERSALGVGALAAIKTVRAEPGELPEISLGELKVSRLILGSNPFFGFSHQSAETDQEMRDYFTDEQICLTLDEAAELGVTAVAAPVYERWIELFASYREQGGKMAHWLAQPDPPADQMEDTIKAAIDGGASAVFIQGARVDERFDADDADVVGRWVEFIKELGVPAGMASHRHTTHLQAEEAGFATDFYYQCLYNPNEGYKAEHRARALATIKRIEKPVIAYKILAAGRNDPEHAFRLALGAIADKDGICVGMYTKHQADQIEEDVALACQ